MCNYVLKQHCWKVQNLLQQTGVWHQILPLSMVLLSSHQLLPFRPLPLGDSCWQGPVHGQSSLDRVCQAQAKLLPHVCLSLLESHFSPSAALQQSLCCFCAAAEAPQVICTCKRAAMPPSSLWLFPPRSEQHQIGGWYFEWTGHKRSQEEW